jgi:catechol 2,3-dioxygenase
MSNLPVIDPGLRIGSVTLGVSDLSRSVDFYERVLGLPLISREENSARLGPERERPLLELTGLAHATPAPPGSTGLFHVAWLHPSRSALAATVGRVTGNRWPIEGAADHGVSEALYLSDPDGLGIEIYADRPREQWDRLPDGGGIRIVTLPLDVDDLLAQIPQVSVPAMPPETLVGHVHLKVAGVPRAVAFYRDALGFEEQTRLPSAGFLAAGGYHHHVGLNSWQSRDGSPPPDSAPGLRLVSFELSDAAALDALEQRLAAIPDGPSASRSDGGALRVRDTDGQLLAFDRSRDRSRPVSVPVEGSSPVAERSLSG